FKLTVEKQNEGGKLEHNDFFLKKFNTEDTINEELSPFIGNSSPSALSKQPMASRSKSHWIPDSHCQECFECGSKFTTFLRRHHCRFCGRIFCSHCSAHVSRLVVLSSLT
ncbi:unnamed protein product, partial [Mesocestoides corti]|uniref:FYVE-type domain-containing protein n=1 Tax=Mesocestoides corti TaxID=53468 RepID=A0A0R3UNA8_MESCO